jgi:uncharacterized protein YecT (DUF1311 family)
MTIKIDSDELALVAAYDQGKLKSVATKTALAFCCVCLSISTYAASFDCKNTATPLEDAICADPQLGRADEEMADYYNKLKDSLAPDRAQELLIEQRAWLKSRTRSCPTSNVACVTKLYNDRILALRVRYENLVPFSFGDAAERQGLRGTCGFPELTLPQDALIYAVGAYSGRKLDVQIDQSGHQATQFDIVVNAPAQPVALLLGAYEPSIWNIGWTKGTKIVAVVATGYHRQAVAGLPKDTPILISTYDNRGPCGYTYVSEGTLRNINPFSLKAFGKVVDMVHFAGAGKLVAGAQISASDQLFTSADSKPADFIDKTKPLAGPAGLQEAVAKGILRPATDSDFESWANKKAKLAPKEALPPVAGGDNRKAYRPKNVTNGYVILKPFEIPAGLYGGNLATFFLAEGIPYPKGNLGHSTLYDFNTMECRGTMCAAQ